MHDSSARPLSVESIARCVAGSDLQTVPFVRRNPQLKLTAEKRHAAQSASEVCSRSLEPQFQFRPSACDRCASRDAGMRAREPCSGDAGALILCDAVSRPFRLRTDHRLGSGLPSFCLATGRPCTWCGNPARLARTPWLRQHRGACCASVRLRSRFPCPRGVVTAAAPSPSFSRIRRIRRTLSRTSRSSSSAPPRNSPLRPPSSPGSPPLGSSLRRSRLRQRLPCRSLPPSSAAIRSF